MKIEESPVSSWIQLIECTELLCYDEVNAALQEIVEKTFGDFDVDGPVWSEDNTKVVRLNVYIKGTTAPNFAEELDELSQVLREQEFLLFSQASKVEYAGSIVVNMIIVTRDHIEEVNSQGLIEYLKNRIGVENDNFDSCDVS